MSESRTVAESTTWEHTILPWEVLKELSAEQSKLLDTYDVDICLSALPFSIPGSAESDFVFTYWIQYGSLNPRYKLEETEGFAQVTDISQDDEEALHSVAQSFAVDILNTLDRITARKQMKGLLKVVPQLIKSDVLHEEGIKIVAEQLTQADPYMDLATKWRYVGSTEYAEFSDATKQILDDLKNFPPRNAIKVKSKGTEVSIAVIPSPRRERKGDALDSVTATLKSLGI